MMLLTFRALGLTHVTIRTKRNDACHDDDARQDEARLVIRTAARGRRPELSLVRRQWWRVL
jgi:hypothetical protein